MDPSPFVLTKTQKQRTSTWQKDYDMAEILTRNQKMPGKYFYQVKNRYKEKKVIQDITDPIILHPKYLQQNLWYYSLLVPHLPYLQS